MRPTRWGKPGEGLGLWAGAEPRKRAGPDRWLCCDHETHVPADPTSTLYGTATRGREPVRTLARRPRLSEARRAPVVGVLAI